MSILENIQNPYQLERKIFEDRTMPSAFIINNIRSSMKNNDEPNFNTELYHQKQHKV